MTILKKNHIHEEYIDKVEAWDSISEIVWEIPSVFILENKDHIDLFTKNITATENCCILGATALNLVQTISEITPQLSVLDFSKKMLLSLQKKIKNNSCKFFVYDAIKQSKKEHPFKYKFILADQIMDCFSKQDIPSFFKNISNLLTNNGELRTIVKIGLYEIDKALISVGTNLGTVEKFYNKERQTIDYSLAHNELDQLNLNINPAHQKILIQWYKNRGEEMRFKPLDINETIINAKISGKKFKITEKIILPNEMIYFCFKLTNIH